ncbi:MAG: stage III sporulation protein AF [Clostridia bacterium]|nr:stage III sporulation protein AF [Clostridia bacterium]
MKEYILSVAGIILLSAVITVILPSGKMGKFIKGAMKLFTLVVLVSPFVKNWDKGTSFYPEANVSMDGQYLSHCAATLAEADEKAITQELSQTYSVTAEVEVERRAEAKFPLEKISVKITDFGIIGQDEHIHIMNLIQENVTQQYGCETEVS